MRNKRSYPQAVARIQGGNGYPQLSGSATFLQTGQGVLVTVKVTGLPPVSQCAGGIYALHIHGGESCTGNESDAFADADSHYDPQSCPHPYHAGDLPPLINSGGFAYLSLLTNRFTVSEITGKVMVIHENSDDFTSQPSGDAGKKIGCGKIQRV